MKPFSPEEPGLNPPASSRGHGDESDSDCQIQEGPEPDTSSVERQEQRPQVPASDGPGQPRGTRQAQSREEETLQPPRTQPWRDLEWQQTLQVGTGLNNLNNTCFCSAVLQCLTHTAPLTKFCLDRGHSMRLGNAAATEEYDAFLAVERHVAEVFGSRQSSIAPTFIVANLTKIGSHFFAGVQQDAHEFLRTLTANMHLADLRAGGSPRPHSQEHTGMLHGMSGGLLRSRVLCDACHTNTTSYDTFLDLSLELHRSVTVPEALRSFTNTNVLDGDNTFECSECETKTCAIKRLTLHSTPRVMQLHLKRFGILDGGGSTKIGHHVAFPELVNVELLDMEHEPRRTAFGKPSRPRRMQ